MIYVFSPGNLAAGFVTQAHAQDSGFDLIQDKQELLVLGDRPLNAETPAHLLDDEIMPYERLFVRMNGLVPQTALDQDAVGWMLTIDGKVENQLSLTIADLESQFENVTRRLVIECGGNGRAFFQPGTSGNQWTIEAVGCPEWTGVRLTQDCPRSEGTAQLLKAMQTLPSPDLCDTAHCPAYMGMTTPVATSHTFCAMFIDMIRRGVCVA